MSTITLTSSKSYEQIIAAPMDIYVRRSDAGDLDDTHDKSFVNLGYTSRGSTVVNISPVIADTEGGEYAILYNVKVRTVLAQAHADILTILKNLKTRENVDVLYYHEAFSEDNFIHRDMNMFVDGDVDISQSKNRGIPVTFTGQFSNIDEIFFPSLQTICIPIEYFLNRNTNIAAALPVFTLADYLGAYISATIGARSGYFDDSSDNDSQLGISLLSDGFRLSAPITIASLSGHEIGFALYGDASYAHYILLHNGTCKCWKVRISDGYSVHQRTYNLIHNTATESFTLMIEVNNGTAKIYDDTTLIGTYTLTGSNWYVGAAIKTNNGTGSEDNRVGVLSYTSDLILPEYLMADEFEHFTDVDYDDLITPA